MWHLYLPSSFSVSERSSPSSSQAGPNIIQEKTWICIWGGSMEDHGLLPSSVWSSCLCFLHGMLEEYRVFLENLPFPSFSRLRESARRTNESVRRTSKSSSINRPNPLARLASRKRSIIATLEKGKEVRPLSSKRPSFNKKESWQHLVLPAFPCGTKKATALVE